MGKFVDVTVRIPVQSDVPNPHDIGLAVHSACQEFTGTVFKPFGATVLCFLNKATVIKVAEAE